MLLLALLRLSSDDVHSRCFSMFVDDNVDDVDDVDDVGV